MTHSSEQVTCSYSGLGTYLDLPQIATCHCACGAKVTVVNGRIPFHTEGIDEAP